MLGILKVLGSVAVLLIDTVIFLKNIKTPGEELKHTFIMLQLVFGAILVCTGNGLGVLLTHILLALLSYLFSGGLIKLLWGFSVIGNIVSAVSLVLSFFVE